MYKFNEFVDQKERKAQDHLSIVKMMLDKNGFEVIDKLKENNDPHLYVYSDNKGLSFNGVRIYEIGGEVVYRIQKEVDTHPFGKAYPLPIQTLFDDLSSSDKLESNEIGQEIIDSVVEELKSFFANSYEVETKGSSDKIDPLGSVFQRSSGAGAINSTGVGG